MAFDQRLPASKRWNNWQQQQERGGGGGFLLPQQQQATEKQLAENDNSVSSTGDYPVSLRELISSPTSVYDVLDRLGRGTFGQVVRAWKKNTSEIVAIKILKSTPSYAKQGQMEVDVLSKLSRLSPDEGSFVKAYESFQHHGHICIVFELLHINLYDYLKQSRFDPLPLKYIRPIAQQVLCCLEKLSSLGLVHADLKPENIMLVDPQRFPFKVKVIDFGSAMSREKTCPSCYLQSRYYRAPEVIMGVNFNEGIDMWSLGCVLAELYLGWPLFPGASEYDQITYICQTLGLLPHHLMRNITKATRFFNCDPMTSTWSLKSSTQYAQETGVQSKESRKYIFRSLLDMNHVPPPSASMDNREAILTSVDRMEFISLLSRMLTLDPTQRIRPLAALQTPFITMQHLAMHTNTQTVWEWIQAMSVCHQPRLSTTPIATPLATPIVTPLAGLQHNPLQLLSHPNGGIPSAAACCRQIQQAPPTLSSTTTLYPTAVIPHNGTHLICHVAPSTFGYLPIGHTHLIGGSGGGERQQRVEQQQSQQLLAASHWVLPDTRLAATQQQAGISGGTYPHHLCTCHHQTTPSQQRAAQVMVPDQVVTTAAHLHGNQTDSAHFTNKLLPVQLPAYHPFSRL